MERSVLAQSGKAVDYLVKSSIDFQKILIDVQFQAPTPLANQPSDPNSPDVGSMDFRLMHAPRVKCPMVGRGENRGYAAMTTKAPDGIAARRQRSEEVAASAFDGVDALTVALEGPDLQSQLLFQLAADEPSHAVSLP